MSHLVDSQSSCYKRNMQEEVPEVKQDKILLTIAPMIDISNTHFRYFLRLVTRTSPIYTEMLHHDAILHSHAALLPFSVEEHPVILQLGGSDPAKLAEAAVLGEKYGYDEVNLNVGCPSPRVQKGSFGACLMKEPKLVRECMEAMAKAVTIPCTVKCRLGVDDFDSYEFARDFVAEVSNQGKGPITQFTIHARKAFLKGLNPAQNRNIPPLMYDRVYRLKQDFPSLTFQLNGGIKDLALGHQLCRDNNLQSCMVGRLAYQNAFELIKADQIFAGCASYKQTYQTDAIARKTIMLQYADYIEQLQKGQIKDEWGNRIRKPNPSVLVKPIINFYNGEKYSGKYRQYLSDLVKLKDGPLHLVIRQAAKLMWEGGFQMKWSEGEEKEWKEARAKERELINKGKEKKKMQAEEKKMQAEEKKMQAEEKKMQAEEKKMQAEEMKNKMKGEERKEGMKQQMNVEKIEEKEDMQEQKKEMQEMKDLPESRLISEDEESEMQQCQQ